MTRISWRIASNRFARCARRSTCYSTPSATHASVAPGGMNSRASDVGFHPTPQPAAPPNLIVCTLQCRLLCRLVTSAASNGITARAALNATDNDLDGKQPLSAEVATKSRCVLRASVFQYSHGRETQRHRVHRAVRPTISFTACLLPSGKNVRLSSERLLRNQLATKASVSGRGVYSAPKQRSLASHFFSRLST